MENDDSEGFHGGFEAAFTFPFAGYAWKSKRMRLAWVDLEVWQDALAGPVFSVMKHGNCAYVYERDDDDFAGIKDPTALRARLQQWHVKLTEGLQHLIPATQAEDIDLNEMRRFSAEIWAMVEKAIDIERLRWTQAHNNND